VLREFWRGRGKGEGQRQLLAHTEPLSRPRHEQNSRAAT